MSHVRAGERFTLIDHESLRMTGEVREFEFLPSSMRENNFFGATAVELENGDRIVVRAFEDEVHRLHKQMHDARERLHTLAGDLQGLEESHPSFSTKAHQLHRLREYVGDFDDLIAATVDSYKVSDLF